MEMMDGHGMATGNMGIFCGDEGFFQSRYDVNEDMGDRKKQPNQPDMARMQGNPLLGLGEVLYLRRKTRSLGYAESSCHGHMGELRYDLQIDER